VHRQPLVDAAFLAEGLEKHGTTCRIATVTLPEFDRVRQSPSEMRSVNLARILEDSAVMERFIEAVRTLRHDDEALLLPEIFGLGSSKAVARLREALGKDCLFAGTMPPSVPGIRTQKQLRRFYEETGGTFLAGDEAVAANLAEGRVQAVSTRNLGSHWLHADTFILATGGYFSKGLAATPTRIAEPLFGLDVDFDPARTDWYDRDFSAPQRYMDFGVRTGSDFRGTVGGTTLENLYAIGSILAGSSSLSLGCGAGVAILTALAAADSITGR